MNGRNIDYSRSYRQNAVITFTIKRPAGETEYRVYPWPCNIFMNDDALIINGETIFNGVTSGFKDHSSLNAVMQCVTDYNWLFIEVNEALQLRRFGTIR